MWKALEERVRKCKEEKEEEADSIYLRGCSGIMPSDIMLLWLHIQPLALAQEA